MENKTQQKFDEDEFLRFIFKNFDKTLILQDRVMYNDYERTFISGAEYARLQSQQRIKDLESENLKLKGLLLKALVEQAKEESDLKFNKLFD
jgi:hypothetical protein